MDYWQERTHYQENYRDVRSGQIHTVRQSVKYFIFSFGFAIAIGIMYSNADVFGHPTWDVVFSTRKFDNYYPFETVYKNRYYKNQWNFVNLEWRHQKYVFGSEDNSISERQGISHIVNYTVDGYENIDKIPWILH